MVIGVSGGLDSTHALIVAAKACDRLGVPRSTILGVTMPGFATGEATKDQGVGADAGARRRGDGDRHPPGARQMLTDMDHPAGRGEPVYDVTFENVQAGLRTDYLFRLANQRGGFVVGTGDLSELALGWCTYGVGDQMSHYAVNAGVPKTLIQYLIRWTVAHRQFDDATAATLERDPRHRDLARARPGRRGDRRDPEHRGPHRPVRAARLLPVPRAALRPAAVEGRVPRVARLARRRGRHLARRVPRRRAAQLRPGDDRPVAAGVPPALLRLLAVQALGVAQRAEGQRRRRAVAARGLARAVRRVAAAWLADLEKVPAA